MEKLEIRDHPIFKGVYVSHHEQGMILYTKNLIPGKTIYGEKLVPYKDFELREWDPYRSKLAAMILERPKLNYLENKNSCLYLGAASGTTISHLSDIMIKGIIYGVEVSERSIRQLVQNVADRPNIIPILGNANFPLDYAKVIFSEIDLIYQDVAQPNQAEIAIKNSDYYLKEGGIGILAIKSQSIDSVARSKEIYKKEKEKLQEAGFEILESINIHRHAANHVIVVYKK
ncbi:MAG: fibrillarin-like rRNA/tRNA 2'-O-methyltransferase [Promethearchaeota archaeon]